MLVWLLLLLVLSFGQRLFLPEWLPCRIEKTCGNEENNGTTAKVRMSMVQQITRQPNRNYFPPNAQMNISMTSKTYHFFMHEL
jgi:hypothetical protein